MGKGLVREQLHVFIDDVSEYIRGDFRPLALFGLGGLPGNGLLRKLLSPVITEEVNKVQVALQNQFNTILDAAEEVHNEGVENADLSKYYQRMLDAELVYQNYEGEKQEKFEEDIKRRLDEAAEDLSPLIETDANEFWEALVETYDRSEAHELFEYHFTYYDRLLSEYGDGLKMTTDTLVPINYTKEAERLYPEAERMVLETLKEGYDEEFERQKMSETEKLEKENEELREKVEELRMEREDMKDGRGSTQEIQGEEIQD